MYRFSFNYSNCSGGAFPGMGLHANEKPSVYIFRVPNLNELPITTTSEKAMLNAPSIGLKKPAAASGIATTLYPKAQNKFCLMVV